MFLVTKMNYEAERAMNQKRLRMEEPGHGVVQGNGLPLNYIGKLHFLLPRNTKIDRLQVVCCYIEHLF